MNATANTAANDIAVYLEWTPCEPGDEAQEFSYGTFTDTRAAYQEVRALEALGRTVEIFYGEWAAEQCEKRIAEANMRRREAAEAAARAANTPVIGQGATLHYPQDKTPYVVTAISPTGAKVTLEALKTAEGLTGHDPAGECNGFPVFDHEYTEDELATMRYDTPHPEYAHRRRNGRYYMGSCRITFSGARYYRNYAD